MVFADIRHLLLWVIPLTLSCTPSLDDMRPREVAERVIRARNTADISTFFSTLPSQAQLARSLQCSPNDSLSDALQRTQEEAPATLPLWREAGVNSKIVRFDEKNSEIETVSPGDTVRNCMVLLQMEIKRIDITFINKQGGRSEETLERWTFWRFDGDTRWYYAHF